MKFTQAKMEAIEKNYDNRLKANPIRKHVVGIGINLTESLNGTAIAKNNMVFADVEELDRLIKELQMLKDAIEEETGLVL